MSETWYVPFVSFAIAMLIFFILVRIPIFVGFMVYLAVLLGERRIKQVEEREMKNYVERIVSRLLALPHELRRSELAELEQVSAKLHAQVLIRIKALRQLGPGAQQ